MDDLKKPGTILSVVDLLAIIGSSYYFYKCNEELELKLAGQQKAINMLTTKMNNFEKAQQHRAEGLLELNNKIKELGESVDQLPSVDTLDIITEDVAEIATTLQENNIAVDLPSQMIRAKASRRSTRSEVDEGRSSAYGARRGAVRPSRDTDVKSRARAPVKSDTRDFREGRDGRETRVQTAGHYDEADDDDLIGEVRRQQGS